MSTIRFEPGDLVLIAFPFTNESGAKQRPAMVVLDCQDADMLVARVTTRLFSTRFDIPLVHWQDAGLLAPSIVRLHKLATIEKTLVKRKLGSLQKTDQASLWTLFEAIYCQPRSAGN